MAERAAELYEPALVDELAADDVALARLVAVTGASRALGDGLVGHPSDVVALLDRPDAPPALGRVMLAAVGLPFPARGPLLLGR